MFNIARGAESDSTRSVFRPPARLLVSLPSDDRAAESARDLVRFVSVSETQASIERESALRTVGWAGGAPKAMHSHLAKLDAPLLERIDEAFFSSLCDEVMRSADGERRSRKLALLALHQPANGTPASARKLLACAHLFADERARMHVLTMVHRPSPTRIPHDVMAVVARDIAGFSDDTVRTAGLSALSGRFAPTDDANAHFDPVLDAVAAGPLTPEHRRDAYLTLLYHLPDHARESVYVKIGTAAMESEGESVDPGFVGALLAAMPSVVTEEHHAVMRGWAARVRGRYISEKAARELIRRIPEHDDGHIRETVLRQASPDAIDQLRKRADRVRSLTERKRLERQESSGDLFRWLERTDSNRRVRRRTDS